MRPRSNAVPRPVPSPAMRRVVWVWVVVAGPVSLAACGGDGEAFPFSTPAESVVVATPPPSSPADTVVETSDTGAGSEPPASSSSATSAPAVTDSSPTVVATTTMGSSTTLVPMPGTDVTTTTLGPTVTPSTDVTTTTVGPTVAPGTAPPAPSTTPPVMATDAPTTTATVTTAVVPPSTVAATTTAETTTTIAAATTTAAPTTTVPFTNPAAPIPTVLTGPATDPAILVDIGSTGGLSDVGAGRAEGVSEVATALGVGEMVLPGGGVVIDVHIVVTQGVDPEQTDRSARTDRVTSVVSTGLALADLTARMRAGIEQVAPYQATETDLAQGVTGVQLVAEPPPEAPDAPAWTITITADTLVPGRWIISVERRHSSYPLATSIMPAAIHVPLVAQRDVIDRLQWQITGWEYRHVVGAQGVTTTMHRVSVMTGTNDLNEAARALEVVAPGQRTDFGDTASEVVQPDGTRWSLAVGPDGRIAVTISLDS